MSVARIMHVACVRVPYTSHIIPDAKRCPRGFFLRGLSIGANIASGPQNAQATTANIARFLFGRVFPIIAIFATLQTNPFKKDLIVFTNPIQFRLVRLLRLTRMARMARLLRAMPELLVLIKGMVVAMRSVFFTLCLLAGGPTLLHS